MNASQPASTSAIITLTEDEWDSRFTLVANTVRPERETVWETYGPEGDAIDAMDPHHVWTVLDADGGLYLANGRHWVNRVHYYVTVEPWADTDMYDICLLAPDNDEYDDDTDDA